jgi:S-formylglutathione hydrolase FrmB
MKKCLLLFAGLLVTVITQAATVDTVKVYSQRMHKEIKTVVIRPASYDTATKPFPVLYLLHGAFGNYTNWVTKVPQIQQLADEHQLLIVCPDGGFTSWYFDSPIDSTYQYETFIGTELPQYVDAQYKTIKHRKGRAITGLSMGGHGSIFIAYRHAGTFSACGSTSGALHVSVITKGYEVEKRLGDTIINKKYWTDWSVLNLIEQKPAELLTMIIDCGTEDMVYLMNKAVHEKLLSLKVPHDYIERPGGHNWKYWTTSIDYQLLFFRKHFDKVLREK